MHWFCIITASLIGLAAFAAVAAKEATMSVVGTLKYPQGYNRAPDAPITLNGGEFYSVSRQDGEFQIHNVPSGIYLLEVLSIDDVFPQLKLKVDAEARVVNVVEYKYAGALRNPAVYPIELTAIMPNAYFQPKQPFNLLGMIVGNPMMLMMVFMLGVMLYYPSMIKGLDEEQLKELQGASAEDPMKKFNKMMGIAGGGDDDE